MWTALFCIICVIAKSQNNPHEPTRLAEKNPDDNVESMSNASFDLTFSAGPLSVSRVDS